MKNILVVNSSKEKNNSLLNIFESLNEEGLSFYAFSVNSNISNNFIKNKWPVKLINLGPDIAGKINQFYFIVLSPFFYIKFFLYLTYYKIKYEINSVICLNINEKIIITPIANLLKIKIIWIEDVDSIIYKNKISKFLKKIYNKLSKNSSIITFNEYFNFNLKKFLETENIKKIYPGIKLNKRVHQDNIFNELAHADEIKYKRKFYTIGTIVDLNKDQNIEALFNAIKTCLTVIPNMQLIIVGDGKERKNLSWIAKKMEIHNIIWFVGEQSRIKKWLESFDVYIETCLKPQLSNFNFIIEAMNAELPIIGPKNLGLEEIVPEFNQKNGCLVGQNDIDMLATEIIKLWRDKRLRLKLGKICKEEIENKFTFNKQVEELKKYL